MNRKSFYYHFKDKYDLVNWIFDTEFSGIIQNHNYDSSWIFMKYICDYFYENKKFYRKVINVEGQNSFSEHFSGIVQPAIKKRVEEIMGSDITKSFYVDFFTDAILCAFKRWLSEKNCMTPDKFVSELKSLVESGALYVYRNMNTESETAE